MTQEEKWQTKYNEIMAFMAENHRRPSKYYMEERNNWNWMRHLEERNNWNWMRHQQKLMGKGEMKPDRVEFFEKLLVLCEKYKRVNQYI